MKSHIFVKGRMAFVPLGSGMLCIGTKEEVAKASVEKVVEMVYEAVIVSRYHDITSSHGQVLH